MKKDFTTVCGFCAVVLLSASFVCPGVTVGFLFVSVILGAVWVLDQCSNTATK